MELNNNKYLSAVCSCIQPDSPKHSNIFQKIGRIFSSFGYFIKRLFYAIRYGEWLTNLKARKVVKKYIWNTPPSDKSTARDKIVHNIFKKIDQIKRRDGRLSDGLDSVWISETFDDSDTKKFRRVKKIGSVNDKLLLHIQGDEFGANNKSLEGHQPRLTLGYLDSFLQHRKKAGLSLYGLSDELVKEVSDGLKLEISNNFVEDAQKKIEEAFVSKRNLFLVGGWTGSPGHAMYYEVIPVDDNTATLRLYNLGGGSSNHVYGRVGHKTKALPYLDFKGIEKSRLIDRDVLKALREINHSNKLPGTETLTEYNETDVYHGFKELLHATTMEQDEKEVDLSDLKTTQRSGVCSWRSLMAFLAVRLDKEEYKKFVCDIKLQSLSDRVRYLKNRKATHANWRIINKSHRKLSRKIVKAYRHGTIGKQYLSQAQYELRKVELWLERSREKALKAESKKGNFKQKKWKAKYVDTNYIASKNIPLSKEIESETEVNTLQPHSTIEKDLRGLVGQLKKANANNIPKLLAMASLSVKQAVHAGEHDAVDLAVLEFVKAIPMECYKSFFAKALGKNPQLAEETVIELSNFVKTYFENCFRVSGSETISIERRYVLSKLLNIMQDLCPVIKPGTRVTTISFDTNSRYREIYDHSNDPKILEDVTIISEKHLTIPTKYEFTNHQKVGESSTIDFDKPSKLGNLLLEEFPETVRQIQIEDPNYSTDIEVVRQGKVFSSEHLPEWFKAIRNTYLYLCHLENEPVANPMDKTLNVSLGFKVKVKKNYRGEEFCQTHFFVNGVTGDLLKDYPELAYIRNNPEYRYESLHRRIKSKPLKQCVKYVIQKFGWRKEKGILADHVNNHKIKMSDESFKEIVHIFENNYHWIPEAIAYFQKHPAKIRDPDYQVLFELLLFLKVRFEDGDLKEQFQEEGFSTFLGSYFQQEYQRAVDENSIPTAVYFLRLQRLCSSFAPKEPLFQGAYGKLHYILESNGLTPGVKNIVYAELVASLSKKENLSEQELEDLLVGSAYVSENPISETWEVPQTTRQMKEAFHRHSEEVKKFLGNGRNVNHQVINRVFEAVRGEHNGQWKSQSQDGQFPTYISDDGKHKYCPQNGRIITHNAHVNIPEDILNHPYYRQVCDKVAKGIQKSDTVYEVKSPEGYTTLVKIEKGELTIDQKRNDKWLRFISRQAFLKKQSRKKVSSDKSSLVSRYILESCTHWQELDDPSVIVISDKKTGKTQYKAILKNNKIQSVKKIDENAWLGEPSKLLKHFEHMPYIHEWCNKSSSFFSFTKHRLKSIELPRFGLSFRPSSKNVNKLYCDQFKEGGYYLSKTQSHPSLGSYPHALVLENDQGKVKVILPKQLLLTPEYQESIQHVFDINRKTAEECSEQQEYLVYDLDKAGDLKAQSKAGFIYLAYVLTAVHEYEKAARVLRKYAPKLSRYSKDELFYLTELGRLGEVTGDDDGNAHALKVFAQSLLVKNMINSQTKVDKELLNLILENYKCYLGHYHNVTAIKLSKEDELFVVKYILSQKFDAQLFLRLRELDAEYAKDYVMPSEDKRPEQKEAKASFQKIFSKAPFINTYGDQHVKETRSTIDLEKMLITRASAYITKHFYAFYDICKNGDQKQKKWLREAITFHNHPKQKGAGWVLLLSCIFDHPNDFPDIPTKGKDLVTWWHRVLEIADNLEEDKLANFAKKIELSPETIDLTPDDYHLSDVKSPQSKLTVHYGFKSKPSFKSICDKQGLFQLTVVKEKNGTDLHAWIKNEQTNPVSKEPVYAKECERLDKDFTAHKEKSKEEVYTLSKGSIKSLAKLLKTDKTKAEKTIKQLEIDIVDLANKLPSHADEVAQRKLQHSGKIEKPLSMEELFVYFARRQPEALKERNPVLSEVEINQVFDKIGEYLILSTYEQQRTRAQTTFDKLAKSKDAQEKKDLVQQIALDLLSERHYVPAQNPAYLVFEYYAGILMRKNQVEKLEKFLQDGDTNPVMEMIMGSGKSKVLLPLLGLLRADGVALSTLIVPHALFESVSLDTYRILDDAFSQSLKAFHFNRNTVFTEQSLEMILSDLKAIQENRECVIMTSKSIQCFLLKYIEKCDHYLKAGEYPKELQLMQQIITLLGRAGFPLIDEADTVLNILHEVCFSAGDKRSPDKSESQVVAAIYDILYNDPEVKALARVESDPDPDNSAPVLTETLYKTTIKPILAAKFIEKMKSITFDSLEKTEEVQNFFKDLSSVERKNVAYYLMHDEAHIKEAQAFYDKQSERVKDILALAGEQLSEFLAHTLTRTCEEKYGLDIDHGVAIAIPYSAANTPSVGSQFANAYITMSYTYQYYCKKGVSSDVVELQWERLQSEAIKELKESGAGSTLETTEAWKKFLILRGDTDVPFFNYKPEHLEKVTKGVNSETKRIQGFVGDFILPQLDLYSKKLSCNPHNLIELFSKVSGFTGTLWNSQSMHRKTTAEPEAGTDAKTIHLLWKYSRDEVYTIDEGSPEAMLDQIEKANISYDMISDAGGYFKEGGNRNIAGIIAQKKKVPVAFYNKKNEQTLLNKGNEGLLSDSTIAIENRATFLDQSHTTGSDVKQKRDAIGIVTISRNMLLRDLLQSAWRLRGLAKSQRVKFVITREVEAIIRQATGNTDANIRFDDILRFVMINQTKQQGKDNFKALRQELASVPQALLLKVLISDQFSIEEKKEAFQYLSGEWIKLSDKRPSIIYGTLTYEENSSEVLASEKKRYLAQMQDVFSALPFLETNGLSLQVEQDNINEIVERMKGALSAKVMVPLRDMDDDQTVEIEQETQTETETELEVQEYQETEKVKLGRFEANNRKTIDKFSPDMFDDTDYRSRKLPVFTLKTYLEQDEKLNKFADAFEGISLTLNVLEWPKEDPRIIDLQLLGPHRTPFHFVEINDEGKVLLLSQYDTKGTSSGSLYNLTFGYYDKTKIVSDHVLKKIVKIKFLNGESSFNKKELKFLGQWILEQGVEDMLDFYQKEILAGYPDKAAEYCQSNLHDLFKQLMVTKELVQDLDDSDDDQNELTEASDHDEADLINRSPIRDDDDGDDQHSQIEDQQQTSGGCTIA